MTYLCCGVISPVQVLVVFKNTMSMCLVGLFYFCSMCLYLLYTNMYLTFLKKKNYRFGEKMVHHIVNRLKKMLTQFCVVLKLLGSYLCMLTNT